MESSSFELPYNTEIVVASCKADLEENDEEKPDSVVVALVSSVKRPNEYALIITNDEEATIDTTGPAHRRLFSRMKKLSTKAQRVATATNRLNARHAVRYIIPVAVNVNFKPDQDDLRIGWLGMQRGTWKGAMRQEIVVRGIDNVFKSVLHVVLEVSIVKERHEFIPNGSDPSFGWLWKYDPIIPLPASKSVSELDEQHSVTPIPETVLGKLIIFSWNVAGLSVINPINGQSPLVEESVLTLRYQLTSFLTNKITPDVSLFVVALQESSPLTTRNVVFQSERQGEGWMQFFYECLTDIGQGIWERKTSVLQVGLALVVFERVSNEASQIHIDSGILTSSVRTGYMGLTGNKGCVGVWAYVSAGESITLSFCILNVHLASGEGYETSRRIELNRAVNACAFGPGDMHPFEANFCAIAGDFNSRIALGMPANATDIPLEDELLDRMRSEGPAKLFFESSVAFPATYKLVPKSEGRLNLDPTRRPAWCDRVVYRSNGLPEKFFCLEYNSVREIDFSDHTPVYAVFSLGQSN